VIDPYLQSIADILARSPIVKSHDVFFDKRSSTEAYFRGNIYFSDGSTLHFREFVSINPEIIRFTYVFHYQDEAGRLIFRYDNAPHYPDLANAPHHKHFGDDEVISATPPELGSVLSEIEGLLSS
jgi:hypothetical protein